MNELIKFWSLDTVSGAELITPMHCLFIKVIRYETKKTKVHMKNETHLIALTGIMLYPDGDGNCSLFRVGLIFIDVQQYIQIFSSRY